MNGPFWIQTDTFPAKSPFTLRIFCDIKLCKSNHKYVNVLSWLLDYLSFRSEGVRVSTSRHVFNPKYDSLNLHLGVICSRNTVRYVTVEASASKSPDKCKINFTCFFPGGTATRQQRSGPRRGRGSLITDLYRNDRIGEVVPNRLLVRLFVCYGRWESVWER